jgi:hypothetical protein
MAIAAVNIGGLSVSRMIIGGNPFSGFSHQSPERDHEMREYYTAQRVMDTFRKAEEVGITTAIVRADEHMRTLLSRYWSDGGTIQWIAQTCPEEGPHLSHLDDAIKSGAKAVFIHGGMMDHLLATDGLNDLPAAMDHVRRAGLPVGVAGHDPRVFRWAEANLDVDFYMCSYYNPTSREETPSHDSNTKEWFRSEDRDTMVELIATLSKPAIHYKVMAAGRNDPAEALGFVARHLRDCDAVCVGYYMKDHPDAMEQNVRALGFL